MLKQNLQLEYLHLLRLLDIFSLQESWQQVLPLVSFRWDLEQDRSLVNLPVAVTLIMENMLDFQFR
jgi:hypothetical protein